MKIGLVVGVLLATSVSARAQEKAPNAEAEFLIGVISPQTSVSLIGTDKLALPGFSVGGRFLALVNSGGTLDTSAGFEIQSLMPGQNFSATLAPPFNMTTNFSSLAVLAEVKLSLRPDPERSALRPFVIGGVGFHSTQAKLDATPSAGFVWSDTGTSETRAAVDSTKTGFAGTIQAGLGIYPSERISLNFSGAWYYFSNATYGSTAAARHLIPSFTGVSTDISSIAFLASAAYHF